MQLPSRHLLNQNQQCKHQNNACNPFKVNIIDLWTDFTYCSHVSIVDFEQVNLGWIWNNKNGFRLINSGNRSQYTYSQAYFEPYQTSIIELFSKKKFQLIVVNYFHIKTPSLVTYSDVWETGIPVWAPTKKTLFKLLFFSVGFKQEIRWSSDQWFHNTSNHFEMA